MVPNIFVRIISKGFARAKYYNKRVSVVDVISNDECTVQLENGHLLEGVKENMIETALPKIGGRVLVVNGSQKGEEGLLLDRDDVQATVQFNHDLSVHTLPVGDVTEYCAFE